MNKPPRRSFNGRFPSGPYVMTVVEAERRLSQPVAADPADPEIIEPEKIKLTFRLDGTDAYLTWSVANTPDAKWAWEDLGADFTEIMTTIVGRTFLVRVGRQKRPVVGKSSKSDYINKVMEVLCEVDSARILHERADALAQRTLRKNFERAAALSGTPTGRLELAERAFRLAHPEWKPEIYNTRAL